MNTVAAIVDIGETTARAAADLMSGILAAAQKSSAAQTGEKTARVLAAARRHAFTPFRNDPRATARALADASQTRLAALSGFEARLDELEKALAADISGLKQILEGQRHVAETADGVARRALAERRLLHLGGVEASLARCRLLLRQLLRGEQLSADTVDLMRNVTVPMAARQAALGGLARASDAARALGEESDRFCRELLERDTQTLTGKRQT